MHKIKSLCLLYKFILYNNNNVNLNDFTIRYAIMPLFKIVDATRNRKGLVRASRREQVLIKTKQKFDLTDDTENKVSSIIDIHFREESCDY